MAKKRFTDIEIWDREWYMELKPVHKCLMKYIFDKCDPSGCWKPNWKLASLHIGEEVRFIDLSYLPKEQYEVLDSGKIFIPDFVKFQYGRLSKECKPHFQIIQLIEKNGLMDRFDDFIDERGISVKALRKRLTEPAKKEIFEQDDYQCQYCGERPGSQLLIAEHIIPLIKGGDNSNDNLTTSCKSCNSKKHDDDVFEFIKKHNLIPLKNLYKKLDTLSNKIKSLKEKEKEEEKDKEIQGVQGDKKRNPKNFPVSSDFNGLPKNQFHTAILGVRNSGGITITEEKVTDLWDNFKGESLTGKVYYADDEAVYTHFQRWIKKQKIHDGQQSDSSSAKLGTSAARIKTARTW